MKKFLKSMCYAGIIMVSLALVIAAWRGHTKVPVAVEGGQPTTPARLLRMGPVVDGMVSSRTMGNITVKMEASRIWFRKTKFLGFDNALFKKLVADDFQLTILKDGNNLISLRKNRVEMAPDQQVIKIDHPRVTFPPDMLQPDSIRMDNQQMVLSIKTGASEEIWNLADM